MFSVGITKYSKLGTLLREACLAQSIEGYSHQEEALGKQSKSLKFSVRMFPERVSRKTHSECGQSVPQPESRDGIKGQMETSSPKSFSLLLPGQPGKRLLFFPQVAFVRYLVEGPASPVSHQMTTVTGEGQMLTGDKAGSQRDSGPVLLFG